MVQRDAIHQARLLANRLRRLDSRRRNQRDAADLAFRMDLQSILDVTPAWLEEMVRSALRQDTGNEHLLHEMALDEEQREIGAAMAPPPLQLQSGDPPAPRMPRPRTRMRPLSPREMVDEANAADMAAHEARENAIEAEPLTPEQVRELGLEDEPAPTVTPSDLQAAFERGERDRRIVAGDPVVPPAPFDSTRDPQGRPGLYVQVADGNAEWGMPAPTAPDPAAEYERLVAEAEAAYVEELKATPAAPGVTDIHGNHYPDLRYPNAGEPARVLADGVTVVYDETTAALL